MGGPAVVNVVNREDVEIILAADDAGHSIVDEHLLPPPQIGRTAPHPAELPPPFIGAVVCAVVSPLTAAAHAETLAPLDGKRILIETMLTF